VISRHITEDKAIQHWPKAVPPSPGGTLTLNIASSPADDRV
jgi:hypothetical protein